MKVIYNEDLLILEDYLSDPGNILMEMANIVGNRVTTERYKLPFSFYFSSKTVVHERHAIRVKIFFNGSKTNSSADGYMELHGDYTWRESKDHQNKFTTKDVNIARSFFKTYKILFSAVWENKLPDSRLQDYFEGRSSFVELMNYFENVTEKQYYMINHCKTLEELEKCVRENNIYNTND